MNDYEMFDCPECNADRSWVCSSCSGTGECGVGSGNCAKCGGCGEVFCERCDGKGEVKWADLTDAERTKVKPDWEMEEA